MEPPSGTLSRRRASFPLGTEFVSPREIRGDRGTRHPDPCLSRSGALSQRRADPCYGLRRESPQCIRMWQCLELGLWRVMKFG